jgi:hypothetical protein
VIRTLLAAALLALTPTAGFAACPSPEPEPVAATLREMYAALSADDAARFQRVTAPTFYSYDVGKRYDGMALFELLKTAHANGTTLVWTVEEPATTVACDLAWITYVNRGSRTDAKGTVPVTWLESAVLKHDGTRWRIQFFHSTRAAATP